MTVKDDVSLRWVLCLRSVELASFIHHEQQLRSIKLRCKLVGQHAHHQGTERSELSKEGTVWRMVS